MEIKIKMTLTEEALGMMPSDPEIHETYIASKSPDAATIEEEVAAVGAVAVVSQAVQANGIDAFLSLLMLISVNLGIMNLLPIPGLDGSRIVFHLIEAVRGKPIKPEREAMVHLIGMLFLFSLMIFFTYKDIVRIFFN